VIRPVPLPHGTEVTTRVERVAGARRVPQGAVGRVTAIHDDEYEVFVVGVGSLRYRRDELTPRKGGQLEFAMRREAAWNALSPCVVLDTVVGSRAWGLAGEGSDVDRRGAFVLPMTWGAGLGTPPEELVSADGSSTYWEAGKLVRQALRADPNTLETLFVPGAQALDEMGAWILAERDAFPSLAIYGSFARYALAQLKKLRQSVRLAEHRALLLSWLRVEPAPSLDQVAERLAHEASVSAPTPADATLLAKEYIKQLYHSLRDQGRLERADFAGLVELARAGGEPPDAARELRPKNAYNLLRLLATAMLWLRTGTPRFEVEEPLRTRLLQIKRGEVALAEVLDEAEALTPALEEARRQSPLPARPDLARADALLRKLRSEAARRHIRGAAGPWGTEAPPPPPLDWKEDP
jgi:RNA repair pathway DNA polymerase beta family